MKVVQAMHSGIDLCHPDTKLSDVARIMREHDIGAVPVGNSGNFMGMVTDRDIVCRGLADGKDLSKLTAADVMTKGLVYCNADEDIDHAVKLMEQKKIRRMPVLGKNRQLVGMLSLGDITHAMPADKAWMFTKSVSAHHPSELR